MVLIVETARGKTVATPPPAWFRSRVGQDVGFVHSMIKKYGAFR